MGQTQVKPGQTKQSVSSKKVAINKSLSINNSITNAVEGISRPNSSTSTHANMKKPVVQMKGMKSLQIEIPEEAVHHHDQTQYSNRSEAKNMSMHSKQSTHQQVSTLSTPKSQHDFANHLKEEQSGSTGEKPV
jgi:hypothetical protein